MPRGKPTAGAPKRVSEQVRAHALSPPEQGVLKPVITGLWPTGSTLLNLACSDTPLGGWPLGNISTLLGGSSAGKTMVALTGLACCCEDPRFDDYVLIYDDAEHRNAFDLEYLFGSKFKARVVPPELGASDTVQKFKASVLNLFEQGKPFIYILDSYDALSSDEELEKDLRKALALAKSDEAAKKIAGSYNMEKAKIGGQIMRQIASRLHRTSSALLVVQQYRQNTNAAGPFDKKYITSGGEWPMYYSQMRPALAKIQTLKKTVNGKERPNGVRVRVGFEKNSVSGKMWPVEFDIYYDLGIDDVGSMVKFLVSEGWWPKKGGKIHAKELNIFSTMSKLIEEIEERGLERKVQRICGRCWKEICDKMRLGRKRRFE